MDASISPPTNAPPAPAPAADAAPVPCPLCEYDLRGLTDPRCPECGYHFEWDELRDPRRRFHPWLFEHHPQRNLWSFRQTLYWGMVPSVFWSTLYPTQPSRGRRLVAYWVLCALPLLIAAAALASYYAVVLSPQRKPVPWWLLARWVASNDVNMGGNTVLFSLMLLAWPWVTLAALLVFQVSLRRARLRWVHVLRCVLYSGDVILWCSAPVAVIAAACLYGRVWPPPNPLGEASALLPLALGGWLTYRLFVAYKNYLRFDHALATVVASQAMVVLVFWKLWYVAQGL